MELDDKRYEELVAKAGKVDGLETRVSELESEVADAAEVAKKLETAEVAQKKAEDELAAETKKREALEETANQTTLASERLGKLGSAFAAKLPESITDRLKDQAKTMKDEDWTARVEELAEMTGVKPDEKLPDDETKNGGGTFSKEEIAASQFGSGGNGGGNGGGGGKEPTAERRRSVVAGLAGLGAKKK